MGIKTPPGRNPNKGDKRPCPSAAESTFCLEKCEFYYFCRLPKVSSKNKWRKNVKGSLKGYDSAWSKQEEEAKRALDRSHWEQNLN